MWSSGLERIWTKFQHIWFEIDTCASRPAFSAHMFRSCHLEFHSNKSCPVSKSFLLLLPKYSALLLAIASLLPVCTEWWYICYYRPVCITTFLIYGKFHFELIFSMSLTNIIKSKVHRRSLNLFGRVILVPKLANRSFRSSMSSWSLNLKNYPFRSSNLFSCFVPVPKLRSHFGQSNAI